MDIWSRCQGERHIRPIEGVLFRLVESQEQVATIGYVDTLEEQAVLEELLETSKPDYPEVLRSERHYLLKTPFRYPPLPWGSRFGRVHEPGLFYGGRSVDATLAESAYYRFVFLWSMDGTPPTDKLNSEHTLFSVGYSTAIGVQLQRPPFDEFTAQMVHPRDYSASQTLGSRMRAAGVEAFEYPSARAAGHQLCGALFTPRALADRAPRSCEPALFTRALIERSEGTGCWHCLSGFASSARVAVE
ncbi:RES family NAD+ phosphorylase [uncultured Marinobacter sp.]|uniref:RES family NAD+ phosphorylase n=1 Tax=uncultured Marinobacter sp. TaxID=187379 RepID=UPI0032B11DE2|tara:strand:- start:1480 stop:2214 length:735 start_codon:yes stop_codon:yes gene_type:complete